MRRHQRNMIQELLRPQLGLLMIHVFFSLLPLYGTLSFYELHARWCESEINFQDLHVHLILCTFLFFKQTSIGTLNEETSWRETLSLCNRSHRSWWFYGKTWTLQCTEEWKPKVAKELRFGNSIANYVSRGHAYLTFASPSLSQGMTLWIAKWTSDLSNPK